MLIDETKADDEVSEATPPAILSRRGSRLPDDWVATDDLIQFCCERRPDLNPTDVAEQFRDYWIAQPGQKGVKVDWKATWRNWVRSQRQGQKTANGRSRTMQALDEIATGGGRRQ